DVCSSDLANYHAIPSRDQHNDRDNAGGNASLVRVLRLAEGSPTPLRPPPMPGNEPATRFGCGGWSWQWAPPQIGYEWHKPQGSATDNRLGPQADRPDTHSVFLWDAAGAGHRVLPARRRCHTIRRPTVAGGR